VRIDGEAEGFEDGSRRNSAADEAGLGAEAGKPPAAPAAAAAGDGTGAAQGAADDDVINLDAAAAAQELLAARDGTNGVLVPAVGHAVIAQQLGMQQPLNPNGVQVAGTIINVTIGGKELGHVLAPLANVLAPLVK
jgi:hypothetical protein